jgi:hypothetical protein
VDEIGDVVEGLEFTPRVVQYCRDKALAKAANDALRDSRARAKRLPPTRTAIASSYKAASPAAPSRRN